MRGTTRCRPGPGFDQMVVPQAAQCLADGVAADENRSHSSCSVGSCDPTGYTPSTMSWRSSRATWVARIGTVLFLGRGHPGYGWGVDESQDAAVGVGGEIQGAISRSGDPGERALQAGERRHPEQRPGHDPGGAPTGRLPAMVRRAPVVRSTSTTALSPASTT